MIRPGLAALRNLSIRAKMFLGFAAVIGLVGIGNLNSILSVGRVAAEAAFARDSAFRQVLLLMEVEGLAQRMETAAATAVDVGLPEAFDQARERRRELEQRLATARKEFQDRGGLARDAEDLRRRIDDHFRQGEELLALTASRDWAAFGPARKAFQEAQAGIIGRVTDMKARGVRDLERSLLDIAELTRSTASSVAGVTLGALATALLVAFYLSREILRPLQGLIGRMSQARGGDFSVRAEVISRDETGALSQRFNEMLEHLERREEELRLHRSHLEELVDERTAQLEISNARLQTELGFRRLTQDAQAESEERLWRILNSVHAGILIVESERRDIVDVNAFALELIGARRQDVVGRDVGEFLLAPDGEAASLLDQGEAVENAEGKLRRGDGWCVPILESIVPVTQGGRAHLIASFVDISEVKRQEKALRESEQRYRTLFASAEDAIFILDPSPGSSVRIVDLNPAAARMHGYGPDELRGRCLEDVDGGRLLGCGRREAIERGEWVSAEMVHRRKGGAEFPAQVSAGPLDYGEARYILSFARDVTEQRRAREELEAFNERLRRSNQDLEDFAYVASHDLQEPLRKVQAFGDRLKARCADALGDQGRDYLERMQNASGRMQQLIEDLLTFSRVTTKARPFEVVDLARVAREVISDLEVRIEQTGARVELGSLPSIEADALQMRQLVQNLVGNALKFHKPEKGSVVRLWGEWVDAEPDGSRGPRVRLAVEDDGIGFDAKYADRIFGVFQRLHGRGEYEGTGVGLAVCRKIVERHGGSILAEGWPGQGARFVATLPARQPAA